ncbi:hypothetical protein Mkiyose1665_55160 [Mycobacterium kiyosense]|nr:hypothetical protein SRL2020411_48680 [Mycobacterium kiyosense]GLC16471.1 hypothetical protein SRL2020448_50740 [Mycobacterium kiyosense]GLD01628.1 hypothetical protein Mkiyose1088_34940 [Mycobacterium kiyosense]GLD21083.1 hypothetical protein Mkiyose1385_51820 [Mycobacterium kiyosense]GLD27250.1 hypothetical protein Mkiyose1386_52430 [Mycobacterium kiyosense]
MISTTIHNSAQGARASTIATPLIPTSIIGTYPHRTSVLTMDLSLDGSHDLRMYRSVDLHALAPGDTRLCDVVWRGGH